MKRLWTGYFVVFVLKAQFHEFSGFVGILELNGHVIKNKRPGFTCSCFHEYSYNFFLLIYLKLRRKQYLLDG